MPEFCPLCETSHTSDQACSIRGLAAVKERGLEKDGVCINGVPVSCRDSNPDGGPLVRRRISRLDIGQSVPTRKPKPSKAELKAIIAQLELEKKERRRKKAASQMRWRNKKKGRTDETSVQ